MLWLPNWTKHLFEDATHFTFHIIILHLHNLISQFRLDNHFLNFLSFQDWNFRHFSCVRRCLLIHNTRHVSQSHTHTVFIAQCAMLAFSGMCQSVHKCLVLQSTFSLDVSESLLAHNLLQNELAELDFILIFFGLNSCALPLFCFVQFF